MVDLKYCYILTHFSLKDSKFNVFKKSDDEKDTTITNESETEVLERMKALEEKIAGLEILLSKVQPALPKAK